MNGIRIMLKICLIYLVYVEINFTGHFKIESYYIWQIRDKLRFLADISKLNTKKLLIWVIFFENCKILLFIYGILIKFLI